MKALTLHAPWAHAVAWLDKDIENRTWRPPASVIGTRIAIHAGLSESLIEWRRIDLILSILSAKMPHAPDAPVHPGTFTPIARGAIVATAIIGEPVAVSDSPWFIGSFGWPLLDVRRLDVPVPMKGRLGLWTLPDGLVLP